MIIQPNGGHNYGIKLVVTSGGQSKTAYKTVLTGGGGNYEM